MSRSVLAEGSDLNEKSIEEPLPLDADIKLLDGETSTVVAVYVFPETDQEFSARPPISFLQDAKNKTAPMLKPNTNLFIRIVK